VRECRVIPVDLWWRHSCATNTLHTRLRVQRAPGVPSALYRAKDSMHSSGASRREREAVCGRHCEPTGRRKAPLDDRLREAIQLSFCCGIDCFAALGSQDAL
jgi:hypothetical protein